MADTNTTPYVGRAMKRIEDPRLVIPDHVPAEWTPGNGPSHPWN